MKLFFVCLGRAALMFAVILWTAGGTGALLITAANLGSPWIAALALVPCISGYAIILWDIERDGFITS